MEITIGCDPELFVKDKETEQPRSAWGLVPGTKKEPHKVPKGAVQIDGCALEFNIDPVKTEEDFVDNIQTVMGHLRQMVPDKYTFDISPSTRFNGNHFRALPEEAKELGCEPDFNAYTLTTNDPPDNKTTMRTASGHVHIGFCEDANIEDRDHILRCATLVKQLDVYLGLPSVLFDRDTTRRSMYGRAGCFRPKSYGVEYRVLSNAWLLSENRMRFVFKQTRQAVNDLIDGQRPSDKIGEATLQRIINRSAMHDANYYIRKYVNHGATIANQAAGL